MTKPFYDDGIYVVTGSVIATPTRFYPISNATARIRRDAFWVALAACSITSAAIVTYGDLLSLPEVLSGIGMSMGLLLLGLNTRVLSIDAIGHPRTFIFGSTKRVTALFRAIAMATTADLLAPLHGMELQDDSNLPTT